MITQERGRQSSSRPAAHRLHRPNAPARAPATRRGAPCRPHSRGQSDQEFEGRVDISGGIEASLAGRYATALFELAREERQLEAVGASLAALRQALRESTDLAELVANPLIDRQDKVRAATATAEAMNLDPVTRNFLGVLARNGRLAALGDVIRVFNLLAARHRGEITAEVVTARPLDDDQVEALKSNLRARMGRDISVDMQVDPSVLGGLVVKIGSQMIDGSIRTKLNNLAYAMKG